MLDRLNGFSWYESLGGDVMVRPHILPEKGTICWALVKFLLNTALLSVAILLLNFSQSSRMFNENDLLSIQLGVCSIAIIFAMGTYAHYTIRDRVLSAQNHSIYHRLRHRARSTTSTLAALPSQKWTNTAIDNLTSFGDELCEDLAIHFQALVGKSKIGCCLRAAIQDLDTNDSEYTTIGRSSRLQERAANSISIPYNDPCGLPNALAQEGHRRMLIVRRLRTAIAEGIWCSDENSVHKKGFRVRSAIAVPINVYISNEPSMIGILYITSEYKGVRCPFLQRNAEQAAGFADAISPVLEKLLKTKSNSVASSV